MTQHQIEVHLNGAHSSNGVRQDIRQGLTALPKSLPPKYFYDARGAALFDRITELPEYYLTRAEKSILAAIADDLLRRTRPHEIIELGPGSTAKARLLLDAPAAARSIGRYIPVDVHAGSVEAAATELTPAYPFLQVHGVAADFEHHLELLPPAQGRRVVAFFGSTIGNLDPQPRRSFLAQVRRLLGPKDHLLLGVDLVKDTARLEAAYNDASGVTAEFNRNILHAVNQAVHADFQPQAFAHHAFYNQEASRIEMHLTPASPQEVHLRDLGLHIQVLPNETIWTESSYKFTQATVQAMLAEAGLRLEEWYTDDAGFFALALARPA